ncbi:hypothetical protein [Streptomyces sp. NPDC059063]|uniref:hypothetical protein n=1 Tax=unclassified Streptomyces TaxID=2593676 RepID=UPI00368ABE5E
MTVLTVALFLLLIVLGFKQPLLWLLAAAIVYLLVRRRDRHPVKTGPPAGSSGGVPGPGGGAGGGMGGPATYRDYKIRRARQERWDRRYRRTHPSSAPPRR